MDIWGGIAIVLKLALYIGLLGAVGLVMIRAAYPVLVASILGQMRAQIIGFAVVALLSSVVAFFVRGAALTGEIGGMVDPEILALLWGTPVGDVVFLRVVGTIVIIAGMFVPRIGGLISLIGGTFAFWSFTKIGHVPELNMIGLRVLLLLHLMGLAFWVGVLGPLRHLSLMPEHLKNAADLGHRFGRAAALIVPIVLGAGGVMAWMIVGEFSALFTTGYGRALLIKIGLVGGVLALAAAHKLWLVPSMRTGNPRAARHFARSIEIETLILLGALGVTAVFTSVLSLPY